MLVLLVVACHKTPDPVPERPPAVAPAPVPVAVTPSPAPPATPVGGTAPLLIALSSRDDVSCADVEALVTDPVPALVEVVTTVKMPPSAPMRAAGCLVERHAHEVPEVLEGWMKGDDTKGLALLVSGRLDGLDPELAVRLARAGMSGPWATDLQPAIEKSTVPEVRAVVGR